MKKGEGRRERKGGKKREKVKKGKRGEKWNGVTRPVRPYIANDVPTTPTMHEK